LSIAAEEMIFRGIVHRSLAERWLSQGARGQVRALLVSIAVAWLAGPGSLSAGTLLVAATGGLTWALTGRTSAAILARALLQFLP
jgi:membrane protease YdiL (CAAX protease family)